MLKAEPVDSLWSSFIEPMLSLLVRISQQAYIAEFFARNKDNATYKKSMRSLTTNVFPRFALISQIQFMSQANSREGLKCDLCRAAPKNDSCGPLREGGQS